jgi:undecaprenyl-diphosphatase
VSLAGAPDRSRSSPLPWVRREIGPLIALFLTAVLVLGFGSLASEVSEGETTGFDRAIMLAFRVKGDPTTPLGPAWVQEMARDLTSLGSYALLTLILLIVLGYLLMLRKRGAALFLFAAVVGGAVLSTLLKDVFNRPRPDLVPHAVQVFTASFPSGHAMLSAVTYLTLGALLVRTTPERALRTYALSVAVFLTLVVGVSRVYLGVHWPTDVLAGWCVGAAWALLCWGVALFLQRRGVIEKPAERD